MEWIKPDTSKQYYELKDGNTVLASLRWVKATGTDAEGVIGDRRLLFKRKGIFFHHTSIADMATGSELATFKFSMDRGELIFGDGGKFLWRFEGLQGSKWYFMTNKDSELLCFTVPVARKIAISREAAAVEVLRAIDEKMLILLAVIGWYNIYNILSSGL